MQERIKKLLKGKRTRRGQALAEFALFITLLFILIAGMVDFGRAYLYFNALRDAAEEGAFYGSVEPDDNSGIEQRVRASSDSPIDMSNTSEVDVTVDIMGAPCAGNTIVVTVTYDFLITTPFVGMLLDSQTIPLSADISNTILNPACYTP
jgi:Flp pilus assembly protein TadG